MATLFRADADVEFHPETHETFPMGVSARPSREIFTQDTLEDLPPPRASLASWLGLLVFVAVMLSIITTAGVVAVRERVGDGNLDALVRATLGSLPGFTDSKARALPRADVGRDAAAAELALVPESSASAPRRPAAAAPAPSETAVTGTPTIIGSVAGAQAAEPPSADTLVLEEIALAEKPRGATVERVRRGAKKRALRTAPAAHKRAPTLAQKAAAGGWDAAREAAREHYAAGRFSQAVQAYEQAVQANPSHALTLAGLGAARVQTGDLAGAADAYRRAVRFAPANISLQVALARVYERQGDTHGARTIYQRVLAAEPGHASARAALERL